VEEFLPLCLEWGFASGEDIVRVRAPQLCLVVGARLLGAGKPGWGRRCGSVAHIGEIRPDPHGD
jgi:hypothetical protein